MPAAPDAMRSICRGPCRFSNDGALDAEARLHGPAGDGSFGGDYDQTAICVADGAKVQARRAEQTFTLHMNPLALGAMALAVGAAVAFSLPRTQAEDTLMGKTRDTPVHRAEGTAHDVARAMGQLGGESQRGREQRS
jgi:hypothetical protein